MLCSATGVEVWRPVGHRGGDRLQHRLHLDVPVQPVLGALDQLAVRECAQPTRWGSGCVGIRWAGQDKPIVVHRRRRGHVRHRLPVALASSWPPALNVKVFVLDTQVYSNTGGQASTSTYTGQNTKMSFHGSAVDGKQEQRKEIAQIAMMHPRTFVAQTTCAHVNHFYKSVLSALEFDGPALVNCYTTCQPEHGVADNMATHQAKLAVDTRAFPLLIHDPRKGNTIRSRLSLQGNPAAKDDWWKNPKTGEVVDFIDFCRSEGRFVKHFDKNGEPSETLMRARQDRLDNWNQLQELAGLV